MIIKTSKVASTILPFLQKALFRGLFVVMVFASFSVKAQLLGPGREYQIKRQYRIL